MSIIALAAIAVLSYLLGSISFARLVPRLIDRNADLSDVTLPVQNSDEKMPMLSMGANTASIKYGPKVGCSVGALDIFKVFIPTLVVRLVFPDQPYALVAATAGFIGHCWPVFHGFKGGRGISAFYGGLLAIDPLGALVVAGVSMFIGIVFLKDLLVTYTGGVFLTILWFALTRGWGAAVIFAIVLNVLFVIAMIPEVRMMRQNEKKYGKGDMLEGMKTFPMGKAMLKLMDTFRLGK